MKPAIFIIFILIFVAACSYSLIPTAIWRSRNYFRMHMRRSSYRCLYLTFDDGPDPIYTPQLLALLRQYDIRAAFFVVASFAARNPKLMEQMAQDGHLIGLHSLKHKCPLFQDAKETKKDMKAALSLMDSLNIPVQYYRPPWGTTNLILKKEMKKHGLKPILWTVMAGDWEANTTSEIIENRLEKRVKPNSIICLHDGRGKNHAPQRTINALKVMLPKWKAQGYQFMKVDDFYENEKNT